MGRKMAQFLLQDGYPLLAYDAGEEQLRSIAADGAKAAANNAEVVRECEIIFTSLPLSEIWVDVVERDILPNCRPGQIFIDMGTVTPPETRRIYELLREKGAYLIDSPISDVGGEGHKLFLFIGGDKEIVDLCLPVFERLGVPEHTVYCGPSGSGQIVKGINQMGMGLLDAAVVEIISFGVQCGIEPEVFARAVGVENAPGFRGMLHKAVKNGNMEHTAVKHGQLKYYLKEAEEKGFELPLVKTLHEFLKDKPATIQDANRRSASYWNELMK